MDLMESRRMTISNSPHISKAEGDVVTIKHALAKPLKKCEADIELVQDLHGQEYPYPAGGGKNKIFIDHTVGTALSRGLTATKNVDGSITIKGTYTSSSNGFIGSVSDAVTLPAGEYIISGSTTGWYDSYGVQLYIDANYGYIRGNPVTITLTEEKAIPLRIHIVASKARNIPLPNEGLTFYPMIRLSATTADYAPYENICPISGWTSMKLNHTGSTVHDSEPFETIYDISFPNGDTIYGGMLNLLTGVLTVNRFAYTEDGSTADQWSVNSTTSEINRFYLAKNRLPYDPKNSSTDNLLVNYFKSSVTTAIWNAFIDSTGNFLCYVPSDLIPDIAGWTSYVTSNPLTFIYELDEPIKFQLTPTQITAFKGINNIWADTGETRIAYWSH